MKASEIEVGGLYKAKVSDSIVTVKVISITPHEGTKYSKAHTSYGVLNTKTGRTTTFKSAAKFRERVLPQGTSKINQNAEAHGTDVEGENSPDPTAQTMATVTPQAVPTVKPSSAMSLLFSVDEEDEEPVKPTGHCDSCSADIFDPDFTPGDLCASCGAAVTKTLRQRGEFKGGIKRQSGGQHGPSPLSERDFPEAAPVKPTPVAPSDTVNAPSATNVTGGVHEAAAAPLNPSSRNLGVSNATGPGPQSLASLLLEPEKAPSVLPPHLITLSGAGTGKTTTLVGGLHVLKGLTPVDGRGNPITPSPQQKEVWEAIAQSRDVRFVCFAAFNKPIERELRKRVPRGVDTSTMHGMGFKAVNKAFKLLDGDKAVAENNGRTLNIIEELTGVNLYDLRRTKPVLLKATTDLVGYCKANLIHCDQHTSGGTGGFQFGQSLSSQLDELVLQYDIDLDGANRSEVYGLVPRVLERCLDVGRDQYIDYIDMIWLPVVLNLPMFTYDLLLVDEAQDLNRCQQALALKAIGSRGRLVLCGDPRQAIYAFAGADSESLSRMEELLKATPRGVQTLKLTVTRRCAKRIVKEANQIVKEFHAHESNPEGSVKEMSYPIQRKYDARGNYAEHEIPYQQTYMPYVNEGDMVLARSNAVLVNQCFKFIKQGRTANIQGRDVGKGLIGLAKKCWGLSPDGQGPDVLSFTVNLSNWLTDEVRKENANKNPSESRITALNDRAECLRVFAGRLTVADKGESGLEKLIRHIEDVFTSGKRCPKCRKEPEKDITFCPFCRCDLEPVVGIRLSSIHKAKGLESDRVFYIRLPGKAPKTKMEAEQEQNLEYVAITRAINELVYVS